jgi:hypothetical protein
MLQRRSRRTGLLGELSFAVLAAVAAVGCGDDGAFPVARNRVAGAPVEMERAMRPLSAAPDANPAPETMLAAAADVAVDARLLVITGDGSSAGLAAITTTLAYLGTPYDVLNATTGPALTADYLAAGDHGRYYGVILDSGDLAVSSSSALTDAEWMVLASYEARFGVRRAAMYALPTAAYGLRMTGGFDVKTAPVAAHCTTAGAQVFVGANCAAAVAITDGWAYTSQPTDAFTLPLLVDAAGNVFAATRSYADGREALVLTFAQSPTALHTLELAYGIVNWVTRGLFVGERHVYVSPQIDDIFLASAIYPGTGTTYRITAAELQTFANWQNALRADPLTAQFRASLVFNGYGARAAGQDGLSDKARELGPTFAWINHTWDHREMTAMSYADAYQEFSQNDQFARGAGLSRYSTENLVTPGVTGLDNGEVMRAAFDVGIRQLVSDTSVAGQANPSPNVGYYNAQMPKLLVMPRRPTDLYFNVSQPAEWVAEYAALHNVNASHQQIVATVSDALVRYLLRGENDTWMFHQANLRDIGGGQSLLSNLLEATLDKYAARATFPVLSPTMDDLADIVQARMQLDASGVSATIEPGAKLTVRVTSAATVPVTGLCTPSVETYGGQQISYLPLAAGQSITLSLGNCNPGVTGPGGPAGTGGSSGSGGPPTGGPGGSTGSSGTAGSSGNDGGARGSLGSDIWINGAHSPDAGGCACVAASGPGAGAGLLSIVLAVAIALARGRRARRR